MEYDVHEPILSVVTFDPFFFKPIRFEEYQDGTLIKQGKTDICITMEIVKVNYTYNGYTIKIQLRDNNIANDIDTSFEFDICYRMGNRLLMLICPEDSNDNEFIRAFGKTRQSKNYSKNEPWAGSIFTKNGRVAKVSFSLNNPQRLIEFYN
ncbi:MAG: hypothetical protein IJK62_14905 [Bacteroidales bacterium]|nr:hypothetical protein [Bacteroidales bacterium]